MGWNFTGYHHMDSYVLDDNGQKPCSIASLNACFGTTFDESSEDKEIALKETLTCLLGYASGFKTF